MPSPFFRHGFENDVFISYTHVDDESEAEIQWVSKFELDLRTRLAKVSGRSVRFWRDNKLGGADRFGPEIQQQLLTSAVLVPIVTPSYFESVWCNKEREEFLQYAKRTRGAYVGNKARLIKVVKTRVNPEQYSEELREVLDFRFFVEEPNGRAREFHLSPDPGIQKLYDSKVDDVAQEIVMILRALESGMSPLSKGLVYLAETTSDLEAQRDMLKRTLQQRGYAIHPVMSLAFRTGPEVEELAHTQIAECKIAVHPIGSFYGLIPERSGQRSLTEIQLDIAARNSNGLKRMIWIPPGTEPQEETQKQFIARIREDYPGRGFELLELPLSDLETHLKDRLEPPVQEPVSQPEGDEEFKARIYVMCLPGPDRSNARELRSYLFAQGYEVKFPPTGESGANTLHSHRLETDDAFLIYYGSGDELWVERMLDELRRAKGLRNGRPILARGVYLADPATEEKQDYMTRQATVIPAFSPCELAAALRPFLAEIDQRRVGVAVQ